MKKNRKEDIEMANRAERMKLKGYTPKEYVKILIANMNKGIAELGYRWKSMRDERDKLEEILKKL